MHPGTIINPWQDFSGFNQTVTENIAYRPLVLLASSFDKGTEKMIRVTGQDFYKMYGTKMNFAKHGQAAIQAARLADAGAELLVGRMVADDATLANLVFTASIKKETVQKKDSDGNLLFYNADGEETTEATTDDGTQNEPVIESEGNVVKWEAVSIENCKTMDEVKEAALALYKPKSDDEGTVTEPTTPPSGGTTEEPDVTTPENPETPGGTGTEEGSGDDSAITTPPDTNEAGTNTDEESDISTYAYVGGGPGSTDDGGDENITEDPDNPSGPEDPVTPPTDEPVDDGTVRYPLFIFADNGRGVSLKKVRITPEYDLSKGSGRMFYTLRVFEGTEETEKFTMTFDPDTTYIDQAYGLTEDSSMQLQCYVDPDIFADFVQEIADSLMLEADSVRTYDLINMKTNRGVAMEGMSVDSESIDIDSAYGVALLDGDNGAFGDTPINTEALADKMVEFFLGKIDNAIFDRDIHKICAVFDANYPQKVKDAIAKLANFRQDFFFFRDLGLGLTTYGDIVSAIAEQKENSCFVGNYMTSYQIRDPRTRKRIDVTMMYDLAPAMVNLFITGIQVPAAGYINGMIMQSAIEGTVNFIPRETMEVNQLDLMEELKVNYALFEEGNCVVQAEYTCHDQYSQLSYINNVLAVQQVIRAIRTSCPKKRFTFQSGEDFTDYAENVNNILKPYRNNFKILRFDYQQDTARVQQKIFYGVLYFAFKNWAQTEVFDVYIINSEDQIQS